MSFFQNYKQDVILKLRKSKFAFIDSKKQRAEAVIFGKHSGGQLCQNILFILTGRFWTGGTGVLTENEWVWPMTGTPLTLFDDWKKGELSRHNSGEDCLEYGTQTTKKWNDRKCYATLKFICDISFQ